MSSDEQGPQARPSMLPQEQAALRRLVHVLDPQEFQEGESMMDRVDRIADAIAAKERRIQDLEEQQAELKQKLEHISGTDGVELSAPDERAVKIRSWLYDEATSSPDGTAAMDKNIAKGVVGGRRSQRYEAMRRAADGDDGAMNGSSSLSAAPGVEFEKYGKNDERNTRVVFDLEAAEDVTSKSDLTRGGSS